MRFAIGSREIVVNVPSEAQLLEDVTRRFLAGKGFRLATINLDHLVKLQSSETFCQAYLAQDLVVADGNPIVWLSQIARRPVQLVPGSELVVPLSETAVACNVDVAFVGSTDASLEHAERTLKRLVPGLNVVARISPPMGFNPLSPAADEILKQLDASGARLVFIALGAPKQEVLAARGQVVAPHIGFASVGAGLDFLAGTQVRAPQIVRRMALEWLWRMLSNPKRLSLRYAKCLAILPGQVRAALALRRKPR